MTYPEHVDKILCRLEAAGHCAYIVGGSLRDMILGLSPHDYDLATSALPEQTMALFSDMRVVPTGIKHGTVTVVCDGHPIEITTFRIDGSYTDSRHPDAVSFTDSIAEDLSRRDFTVNAMAYSKERGLVDPFDGQSDLAAGILRAVGDPDKRFSEDALRIMRAFRFSAQLGFDIHEDTLQACGRMRAGLSYVARERIGGEFIKLLTSRKPREALLLMREQGVLPYALGKYCPSDAILSSLEKMQNDDYARLGILMSDADADTARLILSELKCSGKQIIGSLAVAKGAKISVSTPTEARRLVSRTGVYACAAAHASELLGISPRGAAELTLRQINTPCKLSDLKINGKDVAALGARGKTIGRVLEHILRMVVDEPSLNDRDTLLSLAKKILDEEDSTCGTA